jgi:hypothetical protein
MRVTLLRWQTGDEREIAPATPEVLGALMEELEDEQFGAELTIEAGDPDAGEPAMPMLVVSAARGLFSLNALLGDEEYYSLVGDPEAEGATRFLLGGQEIDHPRRYLVGLDRAVPAVRRFLATRAVAAGEGGWERADSDSAWTS